MKKVLVRGPALSRSGYGEHTRFVLRALRTSEDVDLYFVNTNWGETSWLFEDNEERKWIDSLLLKTIEKLQVEKTFDIQHNFQSLAIGSHLNANVILRFEKEINIHKSQSLNFGIGLNHLSNGAFKTPNLGLNLDKIHNEMRLVT